MLRLWQMLCTASWGFLCGLRGQVESRVDRIG